MPSSDVSFGDNVRIRTTADTTREGLAEKAGSVYGVTTPSNTGVTVIGPLTVDRALNVFFQDLNASFWFAEELVEFVDHGAGTEIKLDGVGKRWVRRADGAWDELGVEKHEGRKRWWQFWR